MSLGEDCLTVHRIPTRGETQFFCRRIHAKITRPHGLYFVLSSVLSGCAREYSMADSQRRNKSPQYPPRRSIRRRHGASVYWPPPTPTNLPLLLSLPLYDQRTRPRPSLSTSPRRCRDSQGFAFHSICNLCMLEIPKTHNLDPIRLTFDDAWTAEICCHSVMITLYEKDYMFVNRSSLSDTLGCQTHEFSSTLG